MFDFCYNYYGDSMNCIFCKIINNEIPSYKIYEDETVIAFLDINPDSCGHTLIIPKKHYKDITDINNEELLIIFTAIRKLKTKLEEMLNIDGLTLIQNNGDIQEVKHFHIHLKPYYNENKNLSIENVYELLKEQ